MDTNKPQPDLQALALTKAIRAHESGGNYNASGDAGTSTGAYQYQPATWSNYAQKVLGDSKAPMTPENQNAVTYGMIKTWKDQGLGPAEIAGKWNHGSSTGWENLVGDKVINGKTVHYDTPAYVQGVVSKFKEIYPQVAQQYGQQTPTSNPLGVPVANADTANPQPEEKSIFRKIGDFFTGGTQQFGKTIGESLAAPKNAELYAQAQEQYSNITQQLNDAIKAKVQSGGDPTRLQIALKQHLQTQPSLQDFTGDVINKTGEQVIGEGAQAGLEALSGGLLESGGKALASKSLSGAEKLVQGAKVGSVYGAVGGVSNAMQNNQSAGNVAGQGLVGGVVGGALGAGLEGAGVVAGKAIGAIDRSGIVNKFMPETEARVQKQMGWVDEAKASIAKAYKDALPLTPSQQVKEANLLNKTGDNVYTTLAKYNINAGSEDAVAQLSSVSDQFENAVNHAKDNEHALFNVNEMRNNAYAEVNKNIPSETARETAKNKIDAEIEAMIKGNKSSVFKGAEGQTLVDSTVMERLRRTGNSWTPFNASDPEKVGKSAGWALANAVRDQVEKEGTFPAYREANREWGKVIHAQEILQKIEDSGKTFKTIGGLGGSIGRKMLSGIFGFHTAGIAGTILSEMGSEYAAKILSNPELRTYFDRALLERFGTGKASPEAISKLEGEIKAYVDKTKFMGTFRALPSPSERPIITPSPTTYEPQAQKVNMMNSKPSKSLEQVRQQTQKKVDTQKAKQTFLNEPYVAPDKLPIIK